jgi:hypothetical protein
MKEGLLWYDDDPKRDLAEKVLRAANRYQQKFGIVPEVCYVHPSTVTGEQKKVDGLEIAPLPSVLPHHFWLGREEEA